MTFTDYGLDQFGSYIVGDTPTSPEYTVFGFGSDVFIGSQNYLGSEFLRKATTWTIFEGNPRASVTISTLEANGSNIQEIGIGQVSGIGSDIMARFLSSVGEKNNTFDVDIGYSVKFRRG